MAESVSKSNDSLSISDLEKRIKRRIGNLEKGNYELIRDLFYIDFKGRFRENKQFEKSEFKDYLETVFGYKYKTYKQLCNAYIKFPDGSKQIGVGNVIKIVSKCGGKKVDKVLQEIKNQKLDTQEEIDFLIDANAKEKVKVSVSKDSKLFVQENEIAELKRQIIEKDKLIAKLKEDIVQLSVENDRLRNFTVDNILSGINTAGSKAMENVVQ